MRKMTKSDEIYFIEMMKDGCSDSRIEELSKARHLNPSQVFHFIAVQNAPDCCKCCNHVDFFPDMFPCNRCCRAKVDYYEEVSALH